MSAPLQILVVILALLLAGCEMRLGHAKTPAMPQPTAAKIEHPAPEPESSEPLSIPQTQVELPQPQAIDPEALATPPVGLCGELRKIARAPGLVRKNSSTSFKSGRNW